MSIKKALIGASAAALVSATVAQAETWDMPVAYPATNFHSENAVKFAQ